MQRALARIGLAPSVTPNTDELLSDNGSFPGSYNGSLPTDIPLGQTKARSA